MRPLGRLLVLTAAVLLGWWSGDGWTAEWDVPSGFPVGNLHVDTLRGFAADVARRTGDSVTLRIRAATEQGEGRSIWDDVRSGRVPAGEVLASSLSPVDPIFAVDSIPFLATDYAAAWRLYQVVRPYFQKRLAECGVDLLYAVAWPPQGLFADRPIESARALRGLTLRTYNATTLRLAQLLGAQPRPMAGRDVEAALADGRIQAMITSAATGVDVKAWKHLSHFYDLRAWLPLNLVIVNHAALDGLAEDQRAALRAAAADAEAAGWGRSAAQHENHIATLAGNGTKVNAASAQLGEDLRVLGGVLTQEWIKEVGGHGIAVINDFVR